MERQLLIESISKSLKEIYEKYSSEGILAIYIWGSVLTPDFNFSSSDVDTIAIVEDKTLLLEENIRKQLSLMHPEIKKFGFRFIYKSELDTGISKGALGVIGNPALLLLDLPTWHHVAGTCFVQKDFSLSVPTYTEAIKLRYQNTIERWADLDLIKPEQVQYFVKQILRIIHLKYLNNENSVYTMFSYSLIKELSESMTETEIIKASLKIKESGWDFNLFKRHSIIFQRFLDSCI
jgi:hypothetical protein